MGYAYLSNGKKQGYKILIDEAMDISAVPGEKFFPGTEAVTADGATRFRLNNAHEWVLVYSSPVPVAGGPFLAVERLGPYMYSVSFDALPEDTGDLFITPMGCSSFVQDGKLYRNLDWNYAETAEFLVRTKNYTGMAFIDGLNDGELDAKKIAQLPYRVCDGVNNDGIMVSTHVLFNDWDYAGSGDKTVPLTKIPHLILENVHSMAELETKISEYLANIRQPEGDYILQFLVTDGETVAVILPPESDSGAYEIVDATDNPKLANFRWMEDANVSLETEGLQDRPTGIERWNLMPCDLEDLRFTLAYEDDDRLSEFIGINGTTKESTEEELLEIYELAHAAYISRARNGETWQTMHSVVYSANGLESLHTQENWSVDYAGGDNVFIATFTAGSEGTATCNKTPQEIQQAAFDGKFVCGVLYTDYGAAMMLSCINVEHGEYANSLFSAVDAYVNGETAFITSTRVKVSDDGTISVYEEIIDIPQSASSQEVT